ncbi:hypothetical protein [Nafulsella turpanensis]|uniref:hypothetical protein n=1 Tax=Nafulsella turpanensis TaxID=1265690 RepID=UPI00034B26CE|nr:hypothetical protein [Nafulsella turpanensis]
MSHTTFLLSLIFFSCTSKVEKEVVEKNEPDVSPVILFTEAGEGKNVSDTCFVILPVKRSAPPADMDCAYIAWVEEGRIIKLVHNTDLGMEVSYLGKEEGTDIFLLYDLPTGRQKIFVKDPDWGLKESNWFDNAALGDSVLLHTITIEGFKVFTIEGNKEYPVSWKNR